MPSAADIVMTKIISSRRAMHRIGVVGLALSLPLLLTVMLSISITHAPL